MKIQIEEADLRSVLEKLETAYCNDTDWHDGYYKEAITICEQALGQPAQQDIPKIGCVNHDCDKCKAQQQETWVGLTDEERNWLRKRNQKHDDYAKAVESLLKEKNT